MHQQGGLGKQVNAEIMQLDNHPFAAHAQHHQRDNQPRQKAQGLFVNLRYRWNTLTSRPTSKLGTTSTETSKITTFMPLATMSAATSTVNIISPAPARECWW
ncbi:Uncharacterised protein [Escherichia coli]|uniref:Uncharacterized protein n=1 Tax=Escherichia coli TaxID=562 RepID=A0A377F938_ECOLX|nr:Uncharacterised protein [Escherichia coli]